MLCTTKFYFICIFLYGISLSSFCQTNKADNLFDAGEYFEASIEYDRLLFYSNSRAASNDYQYKKALCYSHLGEYSRALNELQTMYIPNSSDTLFALVAYQQALCSFLNNKPMDALWKIDEFLFQTRDTSTYLNFVPIKILCHNELKEYTKAKAAFEFLIKKQIGNTEQQEALQASIDQLYLDKSLPRIISVDKAEKLSRIIPGTGQMYSGAVGEGVVNFLIHASLLAFSAHQFYYKFYLTGYLGGLGFFSQMYTGGAQRARVLAARNNKNEKNAFNQKTKHLLSKSLEQ